MTYIVGCSRPYYPSVEEFDTIEEAQAEYADIIEREHFDDGHFDVKVWIAEVVAYADIKTVN